MMPTNGSSPRLTALAVGFQSSGWHALPDKYAPRVTVTRNHSAAAVKLSQFDFFGTVRPSVPNLDVVTTWHLGNKVGIDERKRHFERCYTPFIGSEVWCDGSQLPNSCQGSACAITTCHAFSRIFELTFRSRSSMRCELIAILAGLSSLDYMPAHCAVRVFTDSLSAIRTLASSSATCSTLCARILVMTLQLGCP
eukprot:1109964-Amphidinium_carterae.1